MLSDGEIDGLAEIDMLGLALIEVEIETDGLAETD